MPDLTRAGATARLLALTAAALLTAGCSGSSAGSAGPAVPGTSAAPVSATPSGSGGAAGASGAATGPLQPQLSPYSKVMLIAMENKTEGEVLGNPKAPYLTSLAGSYGWPRRLDAGYPRRCPSLAAYLLMTSGSTHGVCDDRNPSAHPITGDNLFSQVAASGRQWRNYAESMPANCSPKNSPDGRYAVRHAPAAYYVTERARCRDWDVPLGTLTAGALHDALAAGTLPAFSFVSPDQCHNMHGAAGCSGDSVRTGDAWVAAWMPKVLASPDFAQGRLVVLVTWDEGSITDNHIPAVVLSGSTHGVHSDRAVTQCSMVRTLQEVLRVPLLGCAATAPSLLSEFRLAG